MPKHSCVRLVPRRTEMADCGVSRKPTSFLPGPSPNAFTPDSIKRFRIGLHQTQVRSTRPEFPEESGDSTLPKDRGRSVSVATPRTVRNHRSRVPKHVVLAPDRRSGRAPFLRVTEG
jgi:hypothetical protein